MGIKRAFLSLVLGSVIVACTGCGSSSQTEMAQSTREPVINLVNADTASQQQMTSKASKIETYHRFYPPTRINRIYKVTHDPKTPAEIPQDFLEIGDAYIDPLQEIGNDFAVCWRVTALSIETAKSEHSKKILRDHEGQDLVAKPLGFAPNIEKIAEADMVQLKLVQDQNTGDFFYTEMRLAKDASRS